MTNTRLRTAFIVAVAAAASSRARIPVNAQLFPSDGRRHDDGARAAERQRRRRAPRVLDEAVRREAGDRRQARGRHHPGRGDSVSPSAAHRTERGHDDQSHGAQAEQAVGLHGALRQGRAQIRSAAHRTRDNAADLRDRAGHLSHGARRRFTHSRTGRQPSPALLARTAARGEEVLRAEAAAQADDARPLRVGRPAWHEPDAGAARQPESTWRADEGTG